MNDDNDTWTPSTEAGWQALYEFRLLQEKHRQEKEKQEKEKKKKMQENKLDDLRMIMELVSSITSVKGRIAELKICLTEMNIPEVYHAKLNDRIKRLEKTRDAFYSSLYIIDKDHAWIDRRSKTRLHPDEDVNDTTAESAEPNQLGEFEETAIVKPEGDWKW